MAEGWAHLLNRWIAAGVLDEGTAARIREFELAHDGSKRLRWPIWIALAFGALTLGAGVLLFVSANWDNLSPGSRFGLVTLLVAAFHVGGALTVERFPAMATTLHAVGTVALGAGIFLAGQIFNLEEHWPGGVMMWALGAAVAWALLKAWPQMALTAVLVPAWLVGEWLVAAEDYFSPSSNRPAAAGVFLLALTYFTAVRSDRPDLYRRVLTRLGGAALPLAALALVFASVERGFVGVTNARALPVGLQVAGWAASLGIPMVLAVVLRREAAWQNLLAMFWLVVVVNLDAYTPTVFLYAWWAIGGIALAAWGVSEARSERINMGAAAFAATVMVFYFSEVMDKLGRSASLIGLGLLFLAGGWAIERVRRRLVSRSRGGQS